MLKVKLMRIGKKNHPEYRVVVAEAKSKLNGKYVAQIGIYNPHNPVEKDQFKLDKKEYASWIKKGAQPTNTVKQLHNKYYKS